MRIALDDPISKHVARWKLPPSDWNNEVTIDVCSATPPVCQCRAGGVYSTLDDLYSLSQALDHVSLLSLRSQIMATSPRIETKGVDDLPDTIGQGYGWFTSRMYNTNVIWNTGDMLGHRSVLLRIPKERLTIIVLSSAAGREPESIATEISDHLLKTK